MSEIFEKAIKGIPLDNILIINCYCHIGFWHNFHVPYNDAKGMLVSMDRLGTDMACITAHSSAGSNYCLWK